MKRSYLTVTEQT